MCLLCTKRNREIGSLTTHLSTSPLLCQLQWDHSRPWIPQVALNKPLASLCFPHYPVAGESFSAGHDELLIRLGFKVKDSCSGWSWCSQESSRADAELVRTPYESSLDWIQSSTFLEDEARILSSQRMMSTLSSPSTSPALLSFHSPLPLLPLYLLFVFGLISHLFICSMLPFHWPSAPSFFPVIVSSPAFQSSCVLLVSHAGCHISVGPTGH